MTTQSMIAPSGFSECCVNGTRYVPTPGVATVNVPAPWPATDIASRNSADDVQAFAAIYGAFAPGAETAGVITMQFPSAPTGNTVTVNGRTYQVIKGPATIQAALGDVLALKKLGFV